MPSKAPPPMIIIIKVFITKSDKQKLWHDFGHARNRHLNSGVDQDWYAQGEDGAGEGTEGGGEGRAPVHS